MNTEDEMYLCRPCGRYLMEDEYNLLEKRCLACLAQKQKRWRRDTRWSLKQLTRVKARMRVMHGKSVDWTEEDILRIFHCCGGQCILTRESNPEELAIVSYDGSPVNKENAIIVSKKCSRMWAIRKNMHDRISPSMIRQYTLCTAIS